MSQKKQEHASQYRQEMRELEESTLRAVVGGLRKVDPDPDKLPFH
jgi:hypothetical protein